MYCELLLIITCTSCSIIVTILDGSTIIKHIFIIIYNFVMSVMYIHNIDTHTQYIRHYFNNLRRLRYYWLLDETSF